MLNRLAKHVLAIATLLALSGCSALGADGPSARSIGRVEGSPTAPIVVSVSEVDVNRSTLRVAGPSLATAIGEGAGASSIIGRGDELSVSLYEAPPAVLFGVLSPSSMGTIEAAQTSKGLSVANQVVDREGMISVPFAGTIAAAGRTASELERAIVSRLTGKANQPQAIVRVVRKGSAEVAVVGEVANAGRYPLSAKGERLLDLIAAAGGSRQAVNKVMVQVKRDDRTAQVPLQQVLTASGENIRLQADDVVTLLYQPYQFVAMGAISKPAEYDFEATGVSLAQALGRVGGLRSDRADIKGVFLFRFEDPSVLPPAQAANATRNADGLVPTIYRLDLRNPASMFAAQNFAMRDDDVLYVSTAPATDLQKLVGAISSGIFSVAGLRNL